MRRRCCSPVIARCHRRIALALVAAVALGTAATSQASVTDDAENLVRLYYSLQGVVPVPDEPMDEGVMAALVLLAEGFTASQLTHLVMQIHEDLPGASNQPFEKIVPPYIRAVTTMGGDAALPAEDEPRWDTGDRPEEAGTTAARTYDTKLPPVDDDIMDLRTRARGGMTTAAIFDLIGFAMFLASPSAAAQGGIGVMVVLSVVGGTLMSTGSLIGTISMSARHRAYKRAGYSVSDGKMAGAWVLTGLSLLFGFGAWASPVFIGIIPAAVAVTLEAINFLAVRQKWNQELIASEGTGLLDELGERRPAVQWAPYCTVVRETEQDDPTAYLGVVAVW